MLLVSDGVVSPARCYSEDKPRQQKRHGSAHSEQRRGHQCQGRTGKSTVYWGNTGKYCKCITCEIL